MATSRFSAFIVGVFAGLAAIDFKSKLQEYAQANKIDFEYNLKQTKGQSHNPIFVVECICGSFVTVQEGKTKQQAQQKCAQVVLEMINKEQKA